MKHTMKLHSQPVLDYISCGTLDTICGRHFTELWENLNGVQTRLNFGSTREAKSKVQSSAVLCNHYKQASPEDAYNRTDTVRVWFYHKKLIRQL